MYRTVLHSDEGSAFWSRSVGALSVLRCIEVDTSKWHECVIYCAYLRAFRNTAICTEAREATFAACILQDGTDLLSQLSCRCQHKRPGPLPCTRTPILVDSSDDPREGLQRKELRRAFMLNRPHHSMPKLSDPYAHAVFPV